MRCMCGEPQRSVLVVLLVYTWLGEVGGRSRYNVWPIISTVNKQHTTVFEG